MSLLVIAIPVGVFTVVAMAALAIIGVFVREKKYSISSVLRAGAHFMALVASALALLTIVFMGIDKVVPDVLTDSQFQLEIAFESIRFAVAMLFVAGVVYTILAWFDARAKEDGTMQSILAYSILFVSAITTAGVVIFTIYSFLSGEVGMRFIYKTATILALTGLISSHYYCRYVKQKAGARIAVHLGLFAAASIAAIVWGVAITGGPAEARLRRLDDRRLSDMSGVQYEIQNYWLERGEMPVSLASLSDPMRGYSLPVDPMTGAGYEYRAIADNGFATTTQGIRMRTASFELCATFDTERMIGGAAEVYQKSMSDLQYMESSLPSYYSGDTSPHWNHKKGRSCFQREIRETKQ